MIEQLSKYLCVRAKRSKLFGRQFFFYYYDHHGLRSKTIVKSMTLITTMQFYLSRLQVTSFPKIENCTVHPRESKKEIT